MPFNGSGTYTRSDGTFSGTDLYQQRESNGDNIDSDLMDAAANDIATALTNTVCKDGQSTMTGNLKMGTKLITGLGDPSSAQDAVTKNYMTATNTPFSNATTGFTATTVQGAIDEMWTENERVIASGQFTNSATLDIIFSALDSAAIYNQYKIYFNNITPVTNDVELYYQFTTDAGSSWVATNYGGTIYGRTNNPAVSTLDWSSNTNGAIAGDATATYSIRNANPASGMQLTLTGFNYPTSAIPAVLSQSGYIASGGAFFSHTGAGTNYVLASYDGIRIYFETGNIGAAGTYVVTKCNTP